MLMLMLALQEHAMEARRPLWQPVLWEGSSMFVATLLLVWQWRHVHLLDGHLLHAPAWFVRALKALPASALIFVVAVSLIRVVVHEAMGDPYTPNSWGGHIARESLKFSIFFLLFLSVVFAVRSYAALVHARWLSERQRSLIQQAQLLQLTQQIEPHFLFNALNTIAELVHTDPARADHLLTRLALLMRSTTDLAQRPTQTLDEELTLLMGYADIMCERFSGRVAMSFQIEDEARACRVPTLCLQPLLENAFVHGVEKHPGPVGISVSATLQAGWLTLQVADTAGRLDAAPQRGVGLSNLQQRLEALHGTAARLTLRSLTNGGVVVSLELPCVY
jgi:two-component system LytT family sensor kinase